MDKNKRRSILNADHCWEVPSAAGRWGLSGWVDHQSETQPKGASGFGIQSEHMNSVLTPICTEGLTNWTLMLNCGPWKLWRLISQLAIPESLGFMPLALPNTEKTVARLSFHPSGTYLFTTFPTFPNHCPMITALIWAPAKADAEAKIWAQVIDLGGVKTPVGKWYREGKQSRKGSLIPQLSQQANRVQSWGELWKRVSDTSLRMLPPRVRELGHWCTKFKEHGLRAASWVC